MTPARFAALVIPFLVPAAHAQMALPFSTLTYSADEDCRWVLPADASVPGNAWYIGLPAGADQRDAWLSAIRSYRREVRDSVHKLTQVELSFRGVRAWIRMRTPYARAIDLRPGERLRIEVEARWLEGNAQLGLALDLLSRENDAWQGWSTIFSAIDIPSDREWHRLTWEATVPSFDDGACWAKPIVGMDATHDATPGHVLVRDISLTVPPRAEGAVRELLSAAPTAPALDRSIYDRADLAWASRAFVCHFTFMYDRSFYDPLAGRYTVDEFLDEGRREFGGYDAVVLWHAYPRIGVDPRNQFDFYRDMPGGLAGLRKVVGRLHARGVKAFIDYNPWDRGTRREPVSDEQALAGIVAAIRADGIFLDTMSAGGADLRKAVDATRRGVAFEPEGSPPIEQLEVCSASWAQGLPELPEPGLLRLKWIEPRHMQHQINRWSPSHQGELEAAFFNGSGMLVWENVFGTWNPWTAPDRATLRRMAPILRLFARNFASDAWEPVTPTLVPGVYANAWPGKGATVWTIVNRTGYEVIGRVLRVPADTGTHVFDLWDGTELRRHPGERYVDVSLRLARIGCVAAITDARLASKVRQLASRQTAEARRPLADPDPHVLAESVIDPVPASPSPRAPADRPPPGMVLVPAGSVTMHISHQRRECGCYPDPGTPEDRWRDFLWGAPFNGTVEHHIGPIRLPAFFIDEHEVTNAEYARFLSESGYWPKCAANFLKHWRGSEPPPDLADHPVVYVDLDDARAYARWTGKRLPTEPEWHRAAQGHDGRTWPWGSDVSPELCNGNGIGTTPVTAYPAGRSPFGCYDMAGNVWEWTESERSDGHTRFCIIRGGSYYGAKGSVWYVEGGPQPCTSHAKFILMYPGLDRCATIGFRCVVDVVSSSVPEPSAPQTRSASRPL